MPIERRRRQHLVSHRRRVHELIADHALAEVQLQVLQERAGPHHLREVEQRIAMLHRRLDRLETALRERAKQQGIDTHVPIAELRSQLARAV